MIEEAFQVRAVLDDVALAGYLAGYSFEVAPASGAFNASIVAMLRVTYDEPDVHTGVAEEQQGRWWPVNRGWSDGQVVQTAFLAVKQSLEHRLREHFTWRGRPVLQPHFPLRQLWDMAAPPRAEFPTSDFGESS